MARIGVLTASDKGATGERPDESGALIADRCRSAGHEIVRQAVLPDDRPALAMALRVWCDAGNLEVIITTGGTGLTARDVTPEATREVAERDVPGIPLALGIAGLQKTPYAALTRGIAVVRGATLIVNLPGSPRGAVECLGFIARPAAHVLEIIAGAVTDCGPLTLG